MWRAAAGFLGRAKGSTPLFNPGANGLAHLAGAGESFFVCDFKSTFEALAFAEDNRLDGVEVLLTFGEPVYDLTVSQDLNRVSPAGNF